MYDLTTIDVLRFPEGLNTLKECVEKHWLIDYIQIFQSYEFQSALTLPSPSSESVRFLA